MTYYRCKEGEHHYVRYEIEEHENGVTQEKYVCEICDKEEEWVTDADGELI